MARQPKASNNKAKGQKNDSGSKLHVNWVIVILASFILSGGAIYFDRTVCVKFPFFEINTGKCGATLQPESPVASLSLVDILKNPNEEQKTQLFNMLETKQGIFGKDENKFSDYTKVEILGDIEKLGEDHPVPTELRSQCAIRTGVCATSFKQVYVAWPEQQDRYSNEKAYVCAKSSMFRKKIIIVNQVTGKAVKLNAVGQIGDVSTVCTTGVEVTGGRASKDNFVQLSTEHLECLLGDEKANKYTSLAYKFFPDETYKDGDCINTRL